MNQQKTIASVFIILVIIGLGIVGYFKAVPSAKNNKGSRPQIQITPEIYDFGEIKYGQIAKHTFKVKNIGQEVLKITKIATSCGCTTAEIKEKSIAPGKEANLNVEYNTGLMSGSHAKGEQERIIYIKTNDPVSPQAEVVIRALVN
jgi:hypothetical protein